MTNDPRFCYQGVKFPESLKPSRDRTCEARNEGKFIITFDVSEKNYAAKEGGYQLVMVHEAAVAQNETGSDKPWTSACIAFITGTELQRDFKDLPQKEETAFEVWEGGQCRWHYRFCSQKDQIPSFSISGKGTDHDLAQLKHVAAEKYGLTSADFALLTKWKSPLTLFTAAYKKPPETVHIDPAPVIKKVTTYTSPLYSYIPAVRASCLPTEKADFYNDIEGKRLVPNPDWEYAFNPEDLTHPENICLVDQNTLAVVCHGEFSSRNTVVFIDINEKKEVDRFRAPQGNSIVGPSLEDICILPKGKGIIVCNKYHHQCLILQNTSGKYEETGNILFDKNVEGSPRACSVLPDGNLAVCTEIHDDHGDPPAPVVNNVIHVDMTTHKKTPLYMKKYLGEVHGMVCLPTGDLVIAHNNFIITILSGFDYSATEPSLIPKQLESKHFKYTCRGATSLIMLPGGKLLIGTGRRGSFVIDLSTSLKCVTVSTQEQLWDCEILDSGKLVACGWDRLYMVDVCQDASPKFKA